MKLTTVIGSAIIIAVSVLVGSHFSKAGRVLYGSNIQVQRDPGSDIICFYIESGPSVALSCLHELR